MVSESSNDWKKSAGRAALAIVSTAAVAAAILLLYSCWCAFTNLKYADSADYTRYENMMWNTAHGRPFACDAGMDSYLRYHLSFTLGLLGFLFRVWDHPLLLAALNWLLMAAGAVVLAVAARRIRLPGLFIAALLLYWSGCEFMQKIQLSGFHGVSLYLLLFPLLYLALLERKHVMLVLPFILGAREEAGLTVLPLLLYFAIRHRYRDAYYYAAFALCFALAAMFIAFPLINGKTLFENRKAEMGLVMANDIFEWPPRIRAMSWLLLPALPLLPRGWKPLLALPSVAILTNLFSANPGQFAFDTHYSATPFVLLCLAMCEALREPDADPRRRTAATSALIAPAWLIAVTIVSYYLAQLLPGSAHQPKRRDLLYKIPGTAGTAVLRIVRDHIPREGELLTEPVFGKFVANRADLRVSDIKGTPEFWVDMIFCRRKILPSRLVDRLATGSWGILYLDSEYVFLRKGAPTAKNAEFLRPTNPATK